MTYICDTVVPVLEKMITHLCTVTDCFSNYCVAFKVSPMYDLLSTGSYKVSLEIDMTLVS